MLTNEKITALSISTLFIVLFHIARGYIISVLLNKFIFSKILHPIIIGQALQHTMMTLAKYIILFSAFVIGLYAAGLQSIITKLGAIIIGIGFAIKEPFADFFSYFIILIQRPIRVGDLIRINRLNSTDAEVTGIVRSINSRTTIIRQKNSQTIIIPNSVLLTRSICNWTYHKSGFTAIEDMFFFVSKHVKDIEQVRQLLIKVSEGHSAVIKNPAPLVRCEAITELGYQIMIRVYIPTEKASDQWDIAAQLRILIIKKFESEQIEFAQTIFVMDASGASFTRLADFDTLGLNPGLPYSWEREKRSGVKSVVRTLPPEDWVEQPKLPGPAYTRITVLQTGEGNAAHELRVEGDGGYWAKAIRDPAWKFVKTGEQRSGAPEVDPRALVPVGPIEAPFTGVFKDLPMQLVDFDPE